MTQKNMFNSIGLLLIAAIAACTVAKPGSRQHPDASVNGDPDAPVDVHPDGAVGGPSDQPHGSQQPLCTANQPLRCDHGSLVRCNGNGTAEQSEPCPLGCVEADLRCADVAPSNGLAAFLDQASGAADLNLGSFGTIDTDSGTVTADFAFVDVKNATVSQSSGPTVRVLIVRSLTANHVTVTGTRALAIVSSGDVKITGEFTASATFGTPGPGAFGDYVCNGGDRSARPGVAGGAGGGGFGSPGGAGGSARRGGYGEEPGAAGGKVTGNESLVPLRGGCDGGIEYRTRGAGGGAIQLVSRTQIVVSGKVAANGSWNEGGGGSGGGILLEAPIVDVSGGVVANGGGGTGGLGPSPAENGRLDANPAAGGPGSNPGDGDAVGRGGNGGAGAIGAEPGQSVDDATRRTFAGHGGGGYGRIRVNTVPGGVRGPGFFSPTRSEGPLGTR